MARSPNFPSLNLQDALSHAVTIHDHWDTLWVPTLDVLEPMGYQTENGASRSAVAALKSFGLLGARKGPSGDALLRVLPAVVNFRGLSGRVSPELETAVHRMALRPRVHRKVWRAFRGVLPSDDRGFEAWLVEEMSFTPFGAASFVRQFRLTMKFAGLSSGGDVTPSSDPGAPATIDTEPVETIGLEFGADSKAAMIVPIDMDDSDWVSLIYALETKAAEAGVPLNQLPSARANLARDSRTLADLASREQLEKVIARLEKLESKKPQGSEQDN